MEIKSLDKKAIEMSNNNSFSGTRGVSEESSYKSHANKICSWDISDRKKQQLLDELYKRYSTILNYDAQNVSVMVAGASNYNPKWNKSNKILDLSHELYEWFSNIEEQATAQEYSKIETITKEIIWGTLDGYNVNQKWRALAEISRADFNILFEELNATNPFKKPSIPWKIYNDVEKIAENGKKEIYADKDYVAYKYQNRAFIKFKFIPKRQLMVALKSRGWYWNSHENAWSIQTDKADGEWIKSIGIEYEKYI